MSSSDHTLAKEANILAQLNNLVSEGRNPDTMDIDQLETADILHRINNEDQKVALATREAIPQVAKVVDAVVNAFSNGGRLIYLGAGTSGRIGVLDAVECPPTYSVPAELVVALLAGGKGAMYKSVEGAEDSEELAVEDLKNLQLNEKDVLVGIAASGRTPYVTGGLKYANEVGCVTAGVVCNPGSVVANTAQVAVCTIVGPEALTGSTRMKSGTAQKLICNMITTASMIRFGKVYQNLMVDVHASNEKLYARASRIVIQATGCDHQQAKTALEQAEYNAKVAILMILSGVSAEQAKETLANNKGFLQKAINS